MSLSLAALRELVNFGLTAEQILRVAEAQGEKTSSSGAERQRRYRERRRNAGDVTRDASPAPSLQDKVPPDPLKTQPLNQSPSPLTGAHGSTSQTPFERFWEAYPTKAGKGAARKAFDRALPKIRSPDGVSVMISAIGRQAGWRKWTEGFVPNPATWLNQERWTDEEPINGQRTSAHTDNVRNFAAGLTAAVEQRRRQQAGDTADFFGPAIAIRSP